MKTKFSTRLGLAAVSGLGILAGCSQKGTTQTITAPEGTHTTHTNSGHSAAGHTGAGHADGAGHTMEGGHTHTTKLLVSTQPARLQAGKPVKWTLKVVDDIDNTPISDFDIVHDKLMHLIVVSRDMSWFNHLHPEHKGNGVFELEATLPRAGAYKLYADYHPTERENEVAQHAFTVGGARAVASTPRLTADSPRGAWITKTVKSAPEGEPDKVTGPAYQVALMPMPAKLEAGKEVMLHFQVRDASGKPVKLERYLGATGHLVLLSADSNTYLHTHPLDAGSSGHEGHAMGGMNHGTMDHGTMPKGGEKAGGGTSDVMFHTGFPKAGLYKAWGQFKHGGKIITAPFVLNVGATTTAAASASSATSTPPTRSTNGVQRATVVIDGGYTPATLNVKAGQPVALTFVRKEKFGCGEVVQIPALKLKTKSLKTGEKTTLNFTPEQTGTLRFTCGMDMYDGKIAVAQ
jgi:hypothetical protein